MDLNKLSHLKDKKIYIRNSNQVENLESRWCNDRLAVAHSGEAYDRPSLHITVTKLDKSHVVVVNINTKYEAPTGCDNNDQGVPPQTISALLKYLEHGYKTECGCSNF